MADNTYFNSNWTKIVIELAQTGTSSIYDKFIPNNKEIKQYHDANLIQKTPLIEEFEANLNEPIALRNAYIASKTNPNIDDRIKAYDEFWSHPKNMERAREIQNRYKRPNDEQYLPILLRLRNMIFKINKQIMFDPDQPKIHPASILDTSNSDILITDDEIFEAVEHHLGVKFKQTSYLGSIILQFNNWRYGLGLQRYHLYDNSFPNRPLSSIIIHHVQSNPTCTPLLTDIPTQVINTTGGYNLAHELTHAVNFSFVPYYKIPRDMVEIAPMCAENAIREINDDPIEPNIIKRQLALSIADLSTNTPDNFNECYANLMNYRNVGDIRARMWHFTNLPYKYYQYALGMNCTNYAALYNAVRTTDSNVILKCSDSDDSWLTHRN